MTRAHYQGTRAWRYEADRKRQAKWRFETRTVTKVLAMLNGKIGSIIDAPVGTGRFLALYPPVPVLGLDLSQDMLDIAAAKDTGTELRRHDLLNDGMTEWADLVVCVRFLNLVGWADAARALGNLLGAAKRYAMFTMRTVPGSFKGAMRLGRVFLHRDGELLRLLDAQGFEAVERYRFKDSVPGNYDLLLCQRVREQ